MGSTDDETQAILDQLRNSGGRVTPGRRAVIAVLLRRRGSHLSAEEIMTLVHVDDPQVSEATVYRTLTALEALGTLRHVHLGHGPSTYHLSRHAHHHLVCHGCGTVTEVPTEEFRSLSDCLQTKYGFHILPYHFAMDGECHHCQLTSSGRLSLFPAGVPLE